MKQLKNSIFNKRKILSFLVFMLFCAINNSFGQTYMVTKTYSGPTVTVDDNVVTIDPVNFSTSDFPTGCVIEDVSVTIVWNKTDGTCASPGTGNSWHNETGFTISSATGGDVILAPTGTWSGSASISNVTTIFNNTGATPSGVPTSDSFGASGDLSSYDGDNPIGDWNLITEDTAGGDPLCIASYSVTVTVTDLDASAGSDQSLCEGTPTTLSATANGTGLSYDWDVAGVPDIQTPTFTHTMSGDADETIDYTVTVTDDNGCTDTDVVRVTYTSSPEVTVSNVDSCGSNNGIITFTFSANSVRTNIEFSLDGGATYPLYVVDTAGSASFTSLGAGTYDLWVRWGNDECPIDLPDVTIASSPFPALTVNAGSNQLICVDPIALSTSVTLSATTTGGAPPYTYDWDVAGVPDVQSPTFTHIMPGINNQNIDYTVTVTDGNGCSDLDVIRVQYRSDPIATASKVDGTCGVDNGSVTFTFPNHPNRSNIKFSLDGESSYEPNVLDTAGSITYAGLAPGTYDLWTRWGNNQCAVDLGSVTIVDIVTADLSLTKTANVSTVNVGDEVLFTLVVTNSGPCDVTDISVRDNLPLGLTYNEPNSTIPGGTSYSSGIWDLTGLTLDNGDTATLVIAVIVEPNCGTITNTAEIITSSKTDPDSTPDSGD